MKEGSVFVPNAGGCLGQHGVDVVDCAHLLNIIFMHEYISCLLLINKYALKGAVSRKRNPLLFSIVQKLSLSGLSDNPLKLNSLKGQSVNYIQSCQSCL